MSEKVTVKVERSVLHLPAIALRGLVVFPNNLLHFEGAARRASPPWSGPSATTLTSSSWHRKR